MRSWPSTVFWLGETYCLLPNKNFGVGLQHPSQFLCRVPLERGCPEIDGVNDEPRHPDDRTLAARLQYSLCSLANGLACRRHEGRVSISRVSGSDFYAHLARHQLDLGLEDGNVAATAGRLRNFMDS